MMLFRATVLASLAGVACPGIGSDDPPEDVPALTTGPSPDHMAELREAIETALPGRHILVADDAFKESSLLVVERSRHERLGGLIAAGVPDETPQRFRLVLADRRSAPATSPGRTHETANPAACELVHLNTAKRYPLRNTRCRAERAAADRD